LGSGTSACPWKNAEYSAYHQDNDSQQASMLTGRKQILLHSAQQPCLDPCPLALPERKIKTKTRAKTARAAETTSQESSAV